MSKHLSVMKQALHLPTPPMPLVIVLVVGFVAGLIPLGLIAKARSDNNKKNPRVHMWLDMDNQAKGLAQAESAIFADGRVNRLPVAGTVAQGQANLDDHMHLGFAVNDDMQPILQGEGEDQTNTWYDGLPEELLGDEGQMQALLNIGQDKYNTYCFPCHGMGGEGNGPVHIRASDLMKRTNRSQEGITTTWAAPANLVTQGEDGSLTFGQAKYPDGEVFDVITHGKGNMAGYRAQIHPQDRWAIVAYVRALQSNHLSQSDK